MPDTGAMYRGPACTDPSDLQTALAGTSPTLASGDGVSNFNLTAAFPAEGVISFGLEQRQTLHTARWGGMSLTLA